MALDARTPVLVGAAAVVQREPDPSVAHEPLELMAAALERAAADAGAPDLAGRADSVYAPRGFWTYPDPCRLIADRFGATGARTTVTELGVLQTTVFARAAAAIATGRSDIALITAGEAKYRDQQAKRGGSVAAYAQQEPVEPDTVLRAEGDILSALELESGLAMPVAQYAMIENALRAASGQSLSEHRREVAELWAKFSRIAERNPGAWSRSALSAESIREPSRENPMLAFPYTKLHTSQWNVDQACGFILCSVEAARRAGVPEHRWVFPHAIAESNFMQPLSEREHLHRSPGFARTGAAVFEHAAVAADGVEYLELYSCFPSAVRVQMAELGVGSERDATVTGGMAFAGGPLNSFMLQALVRVVELLRSDPGSKAIATAISGFITKQGVSLWSSEPCKRGFAFVDVSEAVRADSPAVPVVAPAGINAEASVVGYTVSSDPYGRVTAILLCELADGRRTLVASDDPELVTTAASRDMTGCRVRVHDRDVRVS